ncbi:flagellar hook-basal body complex protein [Gammaproteobacteria bacterium AS21]
MAGFNTAVSGIRAASSALDVTGNNIANASTTGFKSSRTEFADIYATAALGSGSNQPGSGVLVSDIAQDFSGGTVQFTNNNLDLSIDGSGFFQLDDGRGNVAYTRDGSFELDKDGFIVSKGGMNLQGAVYNEDEERGPVGDLAVTEKTSAPVPTTEMSLSFNIDEANDADQLRATYSREDPSSYTFSTTVGAFDLKGEETSIRYDMVEQRAQKEVHSFEQGAPGDFTVSGVTLDTSGTDYFSGIGTSNLSDATSAAGVLAWTTLQQEDPRIFDVEYDSANNQVNVIFKSEAYEYGGVVVGELTAASALSGEKITYKDSNESHTFALTPGPFTSDLTFKIAGVSFSVPASVANDVSQEEVANTIIAQAANIRDADPTIESISYDAATGLTFTFRASSGDIASDVSLKIEETPLAFFDAATVVDPTTSFLVPGDIVEGDNSYQGVYRMYAYLNPLNEEPRPLNIGNPGDVPGVAEVGPIIIKFSPTSGLLTEVNGETVPIDSDTPAPFITLPASNFDYGLAMRLDISGSTQFADDQIVNSSSQNGYTKGDLTGVSFSSNGEMTATYSNNQVKILGVVQIATFENQAGLQPSGDNQWLATNVSGNALLNDPGTGLNGNLRSSALESSNVDLSAELVKLIEYQRNFQANSKTLETLNTVTQNILQI